MYLFTYGNIELSTISEICNRNVDIEYAKLYNFSIFFTGQEGKISIYKSNVLNGPINIVHGFLINVTKFEFNKINKIMNDSYYFKDNVINMNNENIETIIYYQKNSNFVKLPTNLYMTNIYNFMEKTKEYNNSIYNDSIHIIYINDKNNICSYGLWTKKLGIISNEDYMYNNY
jgi:hypothetical protein